jgi:hypothetical protein
LQFMLQMICVLHQLFLASARPDQFERCDLLPSNKGQIAIAPLLF